MLVMGENRDNHGRMASNGAGKSTLCADAIDWGLFGAVPKGDHADSVINDVQSVNCRVRVVVTDGEDREIIVDRFRNLENAHKNGVCVYVDGEDHTALDNSHTQGRIEQLLGVDRKVFHSAVLYGQGPDSILRSE